ncbi:MAG: leucyl aminopeptidase [Nitrosopumilaceae archaeon]|nr:leucyl aminopeptidase [Nitrosopumilaceae archaeon]
MRVRVSGSAKTGIEMLCGFAFSDDKGLPRFVSAGGRGNTAADKDLASALRQTARDVAGKQGRIAVIPIPSRRPARRLLVAGLGSRKSATYDVVRHMSGKIARKAAELKLGEFAVVAPRLGAGSTQAGTASAIAEGSKMAAYKFDRFKGAGDDDSDGGDDNNNDGGFGYGSEGGSSSSNGAYGGPNRGDATRGSSQPVTRSGLVSEVLSAGDAAGPDLVIVCDGSPRKKGETLDGVSEAVRTSSVISDGNLFVRSVANLPPNECTPQTLADIARGIARKDSRLKCTVVSKGALKRRGFGGITAVGQGSKNEPKLIILEYRGASGRRSSRAAAAGPIVLVGKAVTFDTGGISLKPGASMDEMKFDKCGGCTVLGIIRTAAKLRLRTDIVCIVPAVENMPGGESYRPGDIIRLYSGKTAEILNTDAEGRLILADALAYGERHHKPREIIDFATLTGACIVALGTDVAGMVSNDSGLADAIRQSAARTSEPVWELPLDQNYMDMIKSPVADMKNMGIGRAAGTITAAAFLRNAIKDTPWVHLDIAGVAWTQASTKSRSYKSKGATGFGLRLVMDHLLEQ